MLQQYMYITDTDVCNIVRYSYTIELHMYIRHNLWSEHLHTSD